jgi:hypothetical protein
VLDEKTATQVTTLLDGLRTSAIVPYIPRDQFAHIAEQRQATKTPPGFKDERHGDFFIWAEFLHGLQLARDGGAEFTRVVLVTDDRKPDWSTKGTSHPILRAEVAALVNASFDTWGSASLDEYVSNSLGNAEDEADARSNSPDSTPPGSRVVGPPPTEATSQATENPGDHNS